MRLIWKLMHSYSCRRANSHQWQNLNLALWQNKGGTGILGQSNEGLLNRKKLILVPVSNLNLYWYRLHLRLTVFFAMLDQVYQLHLYQKFNLFLVAYRLSIHLYVLIAVFELNKHTLKSFAKLSRDCFTLQACHHAKLANLCAMDFQVRGSLPFPLSTNKNFQGIEIMYNNIGQMLLENLDILQSRTVTVSLPTLPALPSSFNVTTVHRSMLSALSFRTALH